MDADNAFIVQMVALHLLAALTPKRSGMNDRSTLISIQPQEPPIAKSSSHNLPATSRTGTLETQSTSPMPLCRLCILYTYKVVTTLRFAQTRPFPLSSSLEASVSPRLSLAHPRVLEMQLTLSADFRSVDGLPKYLILHDRHTNPQV